ncbi:MAG: hypothetical protein WAN70_10680 [Terriglobales bacterium]
MQTSKVGAALKFGVVTLLFLLAGATAAMSQEVSVALLQPGLMEPGPAPVAKSGPFKPLPQAAVEHKFWDKSNTALFATVAGFSAADFTVTRDNLSHGGRELNPLTRPFSGSTAGLAANFAGETAGVIGVSYWFHKTGHHKLERLTPLLDFGASAFAVSYGLAHR